MVTVPHRLLDLPIVTVLHASEGLVLLHKRTATALYERPSYVAMHALSVVAEGEQIVYPREGARMHIRAGGFGLMRRGLYYITDLLAGHSGHFATTLAFFDDAALLDALAGAPTACPYRCWFARVVAALNTDPASAQALRALLEPTPRQPLRAFMREHFDKPLTLADYAQLTGRSERSFRRDFKIRFGESPKRWLVRQRLERARSLLDDPQRSVADVAAEVGYASTSHFIERFRKTYGITPGQARQQAAR